jgi:hypothetical protein
MYPAAKPNEKASTNSPAPITIRKAISSSVISPRKRRGGAIMIGRPRLV